MISDAERALRPAWRFPLLFFGAFAVAIAPLYYGHPANLLPFDFLWLMGLTVGAVLTRWWYTRRGRPAKLLPIVLWVILGFAPMLQRLGWLFYLWPFFVRNDFGLLAIGIGLIALAVHERSRFLWILTLAYTTLATLGVVYDIENVYYDVLGLFGVRDQDMPFDLMQVTPVLLPGLLLLAGGLLTPRTASRMEH
ncbi:hypothetical protein GCM10009555_021480 [Acrocarpospora macrocephala]|uniref:Uncharacterized protein n=2 Tax=Acrocarpospora macrocephala TaxID=150177 RepID=A0A5M3WI93_9ACTN|nr:hypothetical protein [Acrocarpospora macrocephala]GES07852.1 hypothetical protein Amac_014470 [Acrocarpospora macrocephala]